MSKKLRVGVLFGGRSGEHEVSISSAASVIAALNRKNYDVIPIGITREGQWLCSGDVPSPSSEHSSPLQQCAKIALNEILAHGRAFIPSVDPAGPKLVPANSHSGKLRSPEVDVIFPVLHGTFGEDGTVQGLLELAGIPYVGAGVLASATGMDKDVMKRLFRDAGLPVADWILVLRREWESDAAGVRKAVDQKIGYPCFVKPANLGSSVGISKVHHRRELTAALELAAEYDRKIIVEKGLDAREIECAVLGNDDPEASLPGEIVPVNEFYDYDAKYIAEGSELIIPARLTRAQTERVRKLSIGAFRAVDCAGMARVDFLVNRRGGKIVLNEVNTIPGFTPISMYPKLWEATGLPYPELLDRLIELALDRHHDKQRNRYD